MTIKIENEETNLCLLGSKCGSQVDPTQCSSSLINEDRGLGLCSTRAGARLFITSLLRETDSSSFLSPFDLVENLLKVDEHETYSSEEDTFVDDDTSISSYGTIHSIERDHESRKVHFSQQLVSEVRERPRTPQEDIRSLFYSYDETQRFRQEYRMERNLKTQSESDSQKDRRHHLPGEDPSLFTCTVPKKRNCHKISHLVVEHQGTCKTFYNQEKTLSSEDNQTNLFSPEPQEPLKNTTVDNFFDNDSFWNGSITWYY